MDPEIEKLRQRMVPGSQVVGLPQYPVDDDTADEFAAMGNDDIADTPNCAKLMDLIKDGNNLEYSCDSMLEYYDPDDEEGSIAAIRNMVTDDIMAL